MRIIDKCIEGIIVALIIVFSPFLLALSIFYSLTNGFSKKCKYRDICYLYSDENEACTNDGEYQVDMISARKADCYKWMKEYGKRKD